MQLSNELYIKISKYLEGEMSRQELITFRSEINKNDELKEEVNLFRQVMILSEGITNKLNSIEAISGNSDNEKAAIRLISTARSTWENEKEIFANDMRIDKVIADRQSAGRNKFRVFRIKNVLRLAAAASVIGLIAVATIWWYSEQSKEKTNIAINTRAKNEKFQHENLGPIMKNAADPSGITSDSARINSTSPGRNDHNRIAVTQSREREHRREIARRKELFEQHFTPDAPPDKLDADLSIAFSFYNSNDLVTALSSFEEIEKNVPRGYIENPDQRELYLQYYKAQIYMALHRFPQAISLLQSSLRKSQDIQWKSKIRWNLALAHLHSRNSATTEKILKSLSEDPQADIYKEKASELLKELK